MRYYSSFWVLYMRGHTLLSAGWRAPNVDQYADPNFRQHTNGKSEEPVLTCNSEPSDEKNTQVEIPGEALDMDSWLKLPETERNRLVSGYAFRKPPDRALWRAGTKA